MTTTTPYVTNEAYPSEMRVQLFPLCCGASVLSGFKDVQTMTDDELDKRIAETMAKVPHSQVYAGEQIKPQTSFVVLNSSQMASPKITGAIKKAGFNPILEFQGMSRCTMWVKDSRNLYKVL